MIWDKGIKNKKFDLKIYEWLKNNKNNKIKDKYNLSNKTTNYWLSHIEHDSEANDQQVLRRP